MGGRHAATKENRLGGSFYSRSGMATSTAPEEVDEATRRQAWADYYKKLEEYNASSNAYAQQQQPHTHHTPHMYSPRILL